jgi:hypothetical protein
VLEDRGGDNREIGHLGQPESEKTSSHVRSESASDSTWPVKPDESLSIHNISSESHLKTSPTIGRSEMSTTSESHALEAPPTKAFSPGYFLRDLTEAIESGLNHLTAIYKKIPLAQPLKNVLAATTGLSLAAAAIADPIFATGVGAICFWQAALRFEKNNHGRAIAILGSTLYTSHMAALGFHELSVCNLSSAVRSIAQSMIADDKPRARILTATLGFAATVGVYSAITNIFPLFSVNNVPLLTLGIGAMSGAFSQKYSWASRATGLSGCGFSIAYHLLVTQSSVGLLATAMFIPGIAWSIWEYDIAKKKKGETAQAEI